MEFGVFLPTKANSWAVVQRAEELGFTHAWFYDTQILSADLLVAMGATGMKTSRIKLCAGVFIPSNRIAPVAANALATLNALAPGRVVFGTSTGYTRPANVVSGPGDAGPPRSLRARGGRGVKALHSSGFHSTI
jgi:5,10-methylenetetrahydromethanopterin reductase